MEDNMPRETSLVFFSNTIHSLLFSLNRKIYFPTRYSVPPPCYRKLTQLTVGFPSVLWSQFRAFAFIISRKEFPSSETEQHIIHSARVFALCKSWKDAENEDISKSFDSKLTKGRISHSWSRVYVQETTESIPSLFYFLLSFS